jgi:hypothetical protein
VADLRLAAVLPGRWIWFQARAGFDVDISVVGADGHEEVVQEALEPGESA